MLDTISQDLTILLNELAEQATFKGAIFCCRMFHI